MAKFTTHYDNLNVSRNAPASVIKAAYKALCQNYHPDKYAGGPEEALRIMKIINGAYAVLSDSRKRAEHDQWIDKQERGHAINEAHRLMTIMTKSYAEPSAKTRNKRSPSDWAMLNRFRKNISSGSANLRLAVNRTAKKLNWLVLLIVLAGISLTATLFYLGDLKTTSVAKAPVSQEAATLLKRARQWVNQGRVAKALPIYLQLAEQGNADAQFHLGLIYAKGQGIAKDEKQAVNWFDKAAKQGYREAQTKLGFMYATGKGVEQNYNSAFYWCYKAAEQGDVVAQYNLGLMYEKGQGVVKDNSLAVAWYSKAVAQGDAHAQYHLGVMYANGVGVTKDSKQAVVLYQNAAKQGLAEAIAALKQLDDKVKD